MKEFQTLKIERDSKVPLYEQLGMGILGLIEGGVLQPNTKLPPIRKMAEALRVNSVTVVNAYRLLEEKRAVYKTVGSGTYVAELNIKELPSPIISVHSHPKSREEFSLSNSINFANTATSKELFPVEEFKALFNYVLDRDKGNAFSYQELQGYGPLREAICTYLTQYGIKSDSDKIQIISGAQQGVDIISKALLSMGDVVFVERPTYYGAVGSFLSRLAQVVEIPLEADGISIERLTSYIKLYKPKLIYLIPNFQTPTCISYSAEKKRRLLELCYKHDIYIIEEDNQSEFNFSKEKVTPLKAMDYKNKVIYIKSFSKILMPGLRLGFMVLPKKIREEVIQAKYIADISTSGFIQRAFHLFISGDQWSNHLAKMRTIFKERHSVMHHAIESNLKPFIKYDMPTGGLNCWLRIKGGAMTVEELSGRLFERSVIITPGSLFSLLKEESPFFRLSFADVEKNKIEEGVKIIGEVFREALK